MLEVQGISFLLKISAVYKHEKPGLKKRNPTLVMIVNDNNYLLSSRLGSRQCFMSFISHLSHYHHHFRNKDTREEGLSKKGIESFISASLCVNPLLSQERIT